MTISTIKKSFTSFFAMIMFFALSLTVYFNLNFTVLANTVSVGSTLFTNVDNISITGTKEGLELFSEGKRDTSAKFNKKLYFGKDFIFTFVVTQADFESIKFTVLTEHGDNNFTGTISDEDRQYTITLTKTANGFDAKLNNDVAVSIASSFIANITIGYDTDTNKFYINEKTKTVGNAVTLTRNEGEVTIGFEGIQIGKAAKLLIKNINGQVFSSDTAGYVNDNTAPITVLNTGAMTYENSSYIEAPINKSFELPMYSYDVLGTIKYSIKVKYSATDDVFEENDTEKTYTSNSIFIDKEGYYKITELITKDNNGNEENFDLVNNPIKIIHAEQWNSGDAAYVPEILDFETYKQSIYNYVENCDYIVNKGLKGGATNKFRFAQPDVKINCTPSENINNIKFEMQYKLSSSNDDSYTINAEGLIFTAKTVTSYDFQFRVIDRMGNASQWTDKITLSFDDYTPPTITVLGFSTEKYVNQSLTLPSGTLKDDMGTVSEKTVKVYYIIDENGNEIFETDDQGNIVYEDQQNQIKKKILVSEDYTFTPERLGWYEVIYTAKDDSGNFITYSPMTYEVIQAESPAEEPFIDLNNTWNIVFLIIAGLSALGLIILLFIKPKDTK